ncbi:MAG: glutamyl-tRNA reductase [Flavobacteriaceae bacterium]|nr:glutamyl-tRNA reductase [Flavobacteriaceae bacterium]
MTIKFFMENYRKENNFYVIGLSYKKADVAIRSKFSLSKDNESALLKEAKELGMDGVMVISTCNRTEIIGFANHPYELISLLCKFANGSVDEFAKVSFVYKNAEAVEHFISVATGLDSQILGDYEIVGQLKAAFDLAKQADTVNAFLERLYNTALHASKEVKNKTKLSAGTTTVSYATVQYIKERQEKYSNPKILVFGLGDIGESTVKGLNNHLKFNEITVINRTAEKAIILENKLGVRAANMSELKNEIHKADILIVATGSTQPTVTADMFDKNKTQLIIDLSIPSNVSCEVKNMTNKKLLDVDMLSAKTKSTLENRKLQIPKVKKIIEEYKDEFNEWVIFRKSSPALSTLKHSLETIKNDAIALNLKKHDQLNPQEVEEITSLMINKIVSKFATYLKDDTGKAEMSIEVIEHVFK